MSTEHKEIMVIEKKLSPIVVKARELSITDSASMAEGATLLSKFNTIADGITDDKEKLTKPLNAALKEVRERYKRIETPLQDAIALVRSKMTTYQTAATEIANAEEDKIAARIGDGKGKIKVETAVRKMGEIERPEASVATDAGLVKFRKVKKFEVMDVVLLCEADRGAFVLPNDAEIRRAMNAGRELPGVRYFTEEVPANFR